MVVISHRPKPPLCCGHSRRVQAGGNSCLPSALMSDASASLAYTSPPDDNEMLAPHRGKDQGGNDGNDNERHVRTVPTVRAPLSNIGELFGRFRDQSSASRQQRSEQNRSLPRAGAPQTEQTFTLGIPSNQRTKPRSIARPCRSLAASALNSFVNPYQPSAASLRSADQRFVGEILMILKPDLAKRAIANSAMVAA